jgi:hypothetical protein
VFIKTGCPVRPLTFTSAEAYRIESTEEGSFREECKKAITPSAMELKGPIGYPGSYPKHIQLEVWIHSSRNNKRKYR